VRRRRRCRGSPPRPHAGEGMDIDDHFQGLEGPKDGCMRGNIRRSNAGEEALNNLSRSGYRRQPSEPLNQRPGSASTCSRHNPTPPPAPKDHRADRQVRDADLARLSIAVEPGKQLINVAGDDKASIAKQTRFVPGKESVKRRGFRKIAGAQSLHQTLIPPSRFHPTANPHT
jgi:hypothetical protein